MRPGDGSDFVYSPIHINATLHCTLNGHNNIILLWMVDGLNFIFDNEKAMLNLRGIFKIAQSSMEGPL